jgi:uncharacterized membrane protein
MGLSASASALDLKIRQKDPPMKKDKNAHCVVCKKSFARDDLVSFSTVRSITSEMIKNDFPEWSDGCYVCKSDLTAYRSREVQKIIEEEVGELSDLEKEVLESLQRHELLSSNIEDDFKQDRTFGEKLSDKLATFGGSWKFLIIFSLFLLIWITINSLVMFWRPADPYPYILLNLILSCLAAVQAPIIMMSQNRQEQKDRLRSQHDYQVNLKAELEIRLVHEKLDHLLIKQWQRLMEIQATQIEEIGDIKQSLTKRGT